MSVDAQEHCAPAYHFALRPLRAASNAFTAQSGHGFELGLSGSLIHDRTVRTAQGLCVYSQMRAAPSACVFLCWARRALNRLRLSIPDYSLFGCPMTTFNKPSAGTSSKLRISRLNAWSNGLWNRTNPGNRIATIGAITAKVMQMNPSSLRTA